MLILIDLDVSRCDADVMIVNNICRVLVPNENLWSTPQVLTHCDQSEKAWKCAEVRSYVVVDKRDITPGSFVDLPKKRLRIVSL